VARYVVTGGAGFIGSHIAERLLRDGHAVKVLDNLSTGRRENLDHLQTLTDGRRLDWLEGDVRSLDTCRGACEEADYVIHEAALGSVLRSIENPAETTAVNVDGVVNLLVAARDKGVKRVVLASSSSVYGETPTLPKHEEMQPAPLSPYAVSKLAGEEYARVFAKTLGLETVSLRYFNVFGPRQDPGSRYAAVIPLFIQALLAGRRPKVFGDGKQSRDFTYVGNVVQSTVDACTRGKGEGEAINIACGERHSLLELLEVLGRILGMVPDPEFLPPRPGDIRHSLAAIEKAQRLLGFAPQTGFEEGLRRTTEFFRR
jgi:nucleoside-diphosphate-sugar epimerase